MILIRICAWCDRFLGVDEIPRGDANEADITHGICDTCNGKERERVIAQLEQGKSFR